LIGVRGSEIALERGDLRLRDPGIQGDDSRCVIPDSRFQIPDSTFQIPDSRFKIQDSRFKCPLPPPGCHLLYILCPLEVVSVFRQTHEAFHANLPVHLLS